MNKTVFLTLIFVMTLSGLGIVYAKNYSTIRPIEDRIVSAETKEKPVEVYDAYDQLNNPDIIHYVVLTTDGFNPKYVEISKGDTVRFLNKTIEPMKIVLDAKAKAVSADSKGIKYKDQSVEYEFDHAGSWRFSNILDKKNTGFISVNDP